jgi:hypothetical protein
MCKHESNGVTYGKEKKKHMLKKLKKEEICKKTFQDRIRIEKKGRDEKRT